MLATVSLARLDRVKGPKRQYVVTALSAADFEAIRRAVAKALNLTHIPFVPSGDLRDYPSG